MTEDAIRRNQTQSGAGSVTRCVPRVQDIYSAVLMSEVSKGGALSHGAPSHPACSHALRVAACGWLAAAGLPRRCLRCNLGATALPPCAGGEMLRLDMSTQDEREEMKELLLRHVQARPC